MPPSLSGSCLCGAVEYEVADAFDYALICHCSQCRRATGSAFKPLAGIARDRLRLVRGQADVLIYGGSQAHDARCSRCGSLLYSVVKSGTYVHVAMGTLLDSPSIRPSMHICVDSKADWDRIDDDLPRHPGLPS